ncbi:MAG: aldo/keto reductase [Anaerolineae bacterium]|nr:aldo/keto reductase [Anaerolineae bacterium]
MDYVNFGTTGLSVSRLSIGTGTNGWGHRSDQTALGLDGLARLLQQGFERGINFWDVADQYGSHPHVAHALHTLPRDQIVIATKTHARSQSGALKDIDRFLVELETDVIDIVLLHCLMQPQWPKHYSGVMEALSRAKTDGKIRAVGVSCHSFGALQAAAASEWVDVVLVRINYAGINMDDSPDMVSSIIQQMYASGKAVYGMKVLGGGRLRHDAEKAVRYVLNLRTVYSITIGASSISQLEENVRLVNSLSPSFPLKEKL